MNDSYVCLNKNYKSVIKMMYAIKYHEQEIIKFCKYQS